MGAPNLNEDNTGKTLTKKVQIAGFSKKGREEELERQKSKWQKLGWELKEYTEGGMSESYAIFEGEEGKSKEGVTFKKIAQGVLGYMILGVVLFVLAAAGYVFFSPKDIDKSATTDKSIKKSIVSDEIKTKKMLPKIHENHIKLTTDGMKMDYPEIIDAIVSQHPEDRELSLVLIVKKSTSVMRAKELGDNFLRQVMTNSGGVENSPSKQIGSTKYNYTIGVYGPKGEGEQIALGAKASFAKKITW